MEEQKNETMETEDKEAGADTAADLEETVQQGADGQRTDEEEVDEPEADGAEKEDSEADESEDAEEPGENTRTIPPIHQAGTVSEASSFSKMNLRSPKKCTWNL